jgi:hypothetical protein
VSAPPPLPPMIGCVVLSWRPPANENPSTLPPAAAPPRRRIYNVRVLGFKVLGCRWWDARVLGSGVRIQGSLWEVSNRTGW